MYSHAVDFSVGRRGCVCQFSERVVKVWNSLPPNTVNFSSLTTLRNSLNKISFIKSGYVRNITAFTTVILGWRRGVVVSGVRQ